MPDGKKIKRSPWKYCRECKCEIKSTTGYCYDHWRGNRTWTACHYGLNNANPDFKFVPHDERR